jgi:hypothetical protein
MNNIEFVLIRINAFRSGNLTLAWSSEQFIRVYPGPASCVESLGLDFPRSPTLYMYLLRIDHLCFACDEDYKNPHNHGR